MTKKKNVQPARPLTRKQYSRAQREARMTRWIVGGAIAIGVIVIGLLIYGYVSEVVIAARHPVATVNGVPIRSDDFQARVRYRRFMLQQDLTSYREFQGTLDPTDPSSAAFLAQVTQYIRQLEAQLTADGAVALGSEVLDSMIQEEIIRQEATRRGITIPTEEIDRAIEENFGYSRETPTPAAPPLAGPITATAPLTPTEPAGMTYEDFQQQYRDYVNNVLKPLGMSEDDLRAMVEASLLYDEVRQAIGESVPATMDQVQFRYMAFDAQEQADEVSQRLNAGESWDDLAAEVEAGGVYTATVSEVDWRTRAYLEEQYGVALAQALFETPVGQVVTRPMTGSDGRYYVLQVQAHQEQELDDLMLSYERDRAFQQWLDQQMQLVERSPDWQEYVPTS